MRKNDGLVNGVAAIDAVLRTFESIADEVIERGKLQRATEMILRRLCCENEALKTSKVIGNADAGTTETIGCCQVPVSRISACYFSTVLSECIPNLYDASSSKINIPVMIDYGAAFSVFLETEDAVRPASEFTQEMLVTALSRKPGASVRCVDMVSGGEFFSNVHPVITGFPNKTGGSIYTKALEFDGLLKQLETLSSDVFSRLGGTYKTVEKYNAEQQDKIEEYIVVLFLNSLTYFSDEVNRLKVLIRNGEKVGMSFILIGNSEIAKELSGCFSYMFCFKQSNVFFGNKAGLPVILNRRSRNLNQDINELMCHMRESQMIDTIYENHPEFHDTYFSLDSTEAIRIPFAINRNHKLLFFEIGGKAPAHALIAGFTGSGKSVALHTLMLQIVHNYHPDDVEIWAVDYKAVEFNKYIEHKTPHFRVIAHDTSEEFSLSLIDFLYEEYEKRKKAFLDAQVKNINEYRRRNGKRSMPRIVVVIDEFQLLTQAVQQYTGNNDYRTKLENLFRLTRAMGISFVLCSQTIASGLSGLSDAARDQIGCRLCLKHEDVNEIRETLMLSGQSDSEITAKAKELRAGQGIYKRARWANEYAPDGKVYEFLEVSVLNILDADKILDEANASLQGDFSIKEEIVVRGEKRLNISEKPRHPVSRYIRGEYNAPSEFVEWYPAAPTTLADAFGVKLENTSSVNMLLAGEDDNLRESVVLHSVCGFLMNPHTRVIASFIDEQYEDRDRMISQLKNIHSDRFELNIGVRAALETIHSLKKIHRNTNNYTVYIWYGLEKLKNEIFLMNQEKEDPEEITAAESVDRPMTKEDMKADLMSFLAELNGSTHAETPGEDKAAELLSFEECRSILKQAFEMGPENHMLHMIIFNNRKIMKKSGIIDLDYFENRIGTRMSMDDSYELFGSSMAANKADENTVIYYSGSGGVVPLRPYLMPDQKWYEAFNAAVKDSGQESTEEI